MYAVGTLFSCEPPLLLYFFFSWKLQTPPQPPSPPAAAPPANFRCFAVMKSSIPHTLNPLSSIFVTFYTLILLYFPSFFLNLLFSPVFISSVLLLLSLLRFGAAQQENREPGACGSVVEPGPDTDQSCRRSFIEWDVGAPLEVIHENYCEGEDALDDVVSLQTSLHRYPSLSRYYPETDSDSEFDSDSDSSSSIERPCFNWEGEDKFKFDQEKDGLIEIQLHDYCRPKMKILEDLLEFQIEEDSFIEIDISPVPSGAGR